VDEDEEGKNDSDDRRETVAVVNNSRQHKSPKREPTVYNLFMKKKMAEIKTEDPSLPHRDVFKLAASKVVYRKAEST